MLSLDATLSQRQQAKRKRLKAKERFKRSRLAEKSFARSLRAVANQVGSIVNGLAPDGNVEDFPQLNRALERYAELLRPWATSVSARMVAEVAQRDEHAWEESAQELGRSLRNEVRRAPTGKVMQQLMSEQVDLIQSLPLEASQRVHKLVIEGLSGGTRAKEIAQEIKRSGKVTASRAMLIARTETSRTATSMTEARATFIGSEGYIWRTAGDADVREIHRKLNGKFFRWDDPPVSGENGERSHPGGIYNCRCYPEPVIPDEV